MFCFAGLGGHHAHIILSSCSVYQLTFKFRTQWSVVFGIASYLSLSESSTVCCRNSGVPVYLNLLPRHGQVLPLCANESSATEGYIVGLAASSFMLLYNFKRINDTRECIHT